MQPLQNKRPLIVMLVFEVLALVWPALLNNGHAIVFPDTRAYFVAGRNAVDKIASMLHPATSGGSEGLETAMQKARAVRSAYYSVLTFLTADTVSLWLSVIIQAAVLLAVLHLVYRLLVPTQPRRASIFVIILGLTTPLSWLVSTAMPDVFAPVAILLACALLLFWEQLTRLERVLACVGIAASCVMHLSNPPLLVGVTVIAALLRWRRLWPDKARYAVVGCGVGLALLATLLVSIVAFHQISLTPNQPPFVLAHSIADGPGKLYLRDHCPQAEFEMCKYLDRLDVSVEDFIWHDNGVYSAIPLESAARIRAEEKRIFWHATLEHPVLAATTTLRDAVRQLFDFTLRDFYIPSYAYASDVVQEMPANIVSAYRYQGEHQRDLEIWIRPTEPFWQELAAIPEYAVVLFSLFYVGFAWRRGELSRSDRHFVVLILSAIVIDALIVAFSDTAARYEARVIWLIPLSAVAFGLRTFPARATLPARAELAKSTPRYAP